MPSKLQHYPIFGVSKNDLSDPIKMVRLTAFVRKAERTNVTELPASSQDFLSTYHLKMLRNLQLFTAFISVLVFLLSFNMVSPLPLTADSEDIEVFLPFDRHLPQANAVTIHRNVSQLDGNNTKLNSEHALVRQRRAAGCVRSKRVENCNGLLITTVKCKRRSVACHGTSANCSPVTTYYGRCGRTFVTTCLCAS